ncbi:MAG: hypothetical protein ABIG28_03610 [archaeon]
MKSKDKTLSKCVATVALAASCFLGERSISNYNRSLEIKLENPAVMRLHELERNIGLRVYVDAYELIFDPGIVRDRFEREYQKELELAEEYRALNNRLQDENALDNWRKTKSRSALGGIGAVMVGLYGLIVGACGIFSRKEE